MKKEDLVTKLDTATPEQLEALGKVFDAPAAAPAVVVEQPAVAAAAKPVKFEDVLAAASAVDRELFNTGKAAGEAKRQESIKALKDTGKNVFSDAELASKTQAELDQLVKLAGAPKVDFSVAGASRVEGGEQEAVPAAPSMTDAVKAARGNKN
jgi:hypothetical protein